MRTPQRRLVLAALVAVLTGCGPDPGDVALLDENSLDELAERGASVDDRSNLLTGLGYDCSNKSGPFTRADGSLASAPAYVWCHKTMPESLICSYRVQVILVPHSAGGTETHFARSESCL